MHECFDGAHASWNPIAQIDLQRQLQVRDHAFQVCTIQRGTVHPCANTRARHCRGPDNARQTCCFHNLIEERTWEFAGHLEAETMARALRHSTILWSRNSNDTLVTSARHRGPARCHWIQTHWMNPCPTRLKLRKTRDARAAWATANGKPTSTKCLRLCVRTRAYNAVSGHPRRLPAEPGVMDTPLTQRTPFP